MPRAIPQLFHRARTALSLTQQQLAIRLGASRRTGQRWDARQAEPSVDQLRKLARLVYPMNASFAAEIAIGADTTLEALGIVRPQRPAAPPPPPAPPQPAPGSVVDSIVCAAAEAVDLSPGAIRPALLAAFARARELGLGVEAVEGALARKGGPAKAPRSRSGPSSRGAASGTRSARP